MVCFYYNNICCVQKAAGVAMPWVDTYTEADIPTLHTHIDFIICLGGDGLMLHAAYLFGKYIPPMISFKLGSMGFLTSHDYEDFREHVNNVINGSNVRLIHTY
jgi:NAD+ kinase